MSDIKSEITKILEKFLRGNISRGKLVQWAEDHNQEITDLTSRGEYLRLKYCERRDIREILDKLKPCPVCSRFSGFVSFSGHDDFGKKQKEVDFAVESGKLRHIKRPSWYKDRSDEIAGGELFYECLKCGAVWSVAFPERIFNGSVVRIG